MHEGFTTLKVKFDNLLVDGNFSRSYTYFDKGKETIQSIPHTCITFGDNEYASTVDVSILAKVTRDEYIEYPLLITCYNKNKIKCYIILYSSTCHL